MTKTPEGWTDSQRSAIVQLCNAGFEIEVKEHVRIRNDANPSTVHLDIEAWMYLPDEDCATCGHTYSPPRVEVNLHWKNYRFDYGTARGIPLGKGRTLRQRRRKLTMVEALSLANSVVSREQEEQQ